MIFNVLTMTAFLLLAWIGFSCLQVFRFAKERDSFACKAKRNFPSLFPSGEEENDFDIDDLEESPQDDDFDEEEIEREALVLMDELDNDEDNDEDENEDPSFPTQLAIGDIFPDGYSRQDYYDHGFDDAAIDYFGLNQPSAPAPSIAGFILMDYFK